MEQLILVDENDLSIGTMEKMAVHENALLHRAFSVFVFNDAGELLMQKRALTKYHSAGLWTNTCCSHPRPGEDTDLAASRRLQEELGFITPLQKVFDFVYKASFDNGLTEHEFDHVFVGNYTGPIKPNPDEVAEIAYISMEKIISLMESNKTMFTVWFHIAFPKILDWWQKQSWQDK